MKILLTIIIFLSISFRTYSLPKDSTQSNRQFYILLGPMNKSVGFGYSHQKKRLIINSQIMYSDFYFLYQYFSDHRYYLYHSRIYGDFYSGYKLINRKFVLSLGSAVSYSSILRTSDIYTRKHSECTWQFATRLSYSNFTMQIGTGPNIFTSYRKNYWLPFIFILYTIPIISK